MTSLCSSFPSSQNTPFFCPLWHVFHKTPPPTSDIAIAQHFSLATFQNYSITFSWANYSIAMFSKTFHSYMAWNFLWLRVCVFITFLLSFVCCLTGNTGITCPKLNAVFAIILNLLHLSKWWLHPFCCSSYDYGSHMWLFSHSHLLQPISHEISILNAFSDTAHYHGSSFWHFCFTPCNDSKVTL